MKNKINLFFTKHKKNYKRILLLGLILLGAFLLFTIARGINNEKVRKENLVLEEKQQEELKKLVLYNGKLNKKFDGNTFSYTYTKKKGFRLKRI